MPFGLARFFCARAMARAGHRIAHAGATGYHPSVFFVRLGIGSAAWCMRIRQFGITERPLSADAAIRAAGIRTEHADPMDDLIVGAARASGTTLLTVDNLLPRWRSAPLRQDASL